MYSDLISVNDFGCVGVVTSSCNMSKLCIAVNDAMSYDLEGLLCYDFMHDVISQWRALNVLNADISALAVKLRLKEISQEQYDAEVDLKNIAIAAMVNYSDLINGSVYTDRAGKHQRQQGIRALWVFYAYAHYIKINPYDDTPNGLVNKSSDFSMPVPMAELNSLSTSYRNRAKFSMDKIKEYLCINKDLFPKFDACDCILDCGCTGSCGCGGTKKIRGFKYKSLSKKWL